MPRRAPRDAAAARAARRVLPELRGRATLGRGVPGSYATASASSFASGSIDVMYEYPVTWFLVTESMESM